MMAESEDCETTVPFNDVLGKKWFTETSSKQEVLIKSYLRQQNGTTCSIVSLCMILNAKLYSNSKETFDEDSLWTELKLTQIFHKYSTKVPIYKLLSKGVSLDEVGHIFTDFGFKSISITHCDQSSIQSLNIFRNQCQQIFSKDTINKVIICNFELSHLSSSINGGHISPIAAYHESSDRVLVLDPILGKIWVNISKLYQAMNTKPHQSHKHRGYLIASDIPILQNHSNHSQTEHKDDTKTEIFTEKPVSKQPQSISTMATKNTSNGHHNGLRMPMAAINTADWFSKSSIKSKCKSTIDIEKCSCINRIGIVLQFYQRSLYENDKQNGKLKNMTSKKHSMYNLLYELLPNYSTVKLLNDYHHIMYNHTVSNGDFEIFYNYICTKYVQSQLCSIKTCKSFHRNYRNRSLYFKQSEYTENRAILYNGFTDAQEIYITKLLDRIYCFVLHSIDCGYKLTQKELTQIQTNIKAYNNGYNENDVNYNREIIDNELKATLDVYNEKTLQFKNMDSHQKLQNNGNNEVILNVDRFTTKIGQDDDDDEKKMEENTIQTAYSFGYAYKYWKNYENNKWYIPSKYKNLKTEIVNNEILSLSMAQFNEEVKNAIDLINSKHGKKIKCKYLKESNDPKQNEIGLKEGGSISIDHMLSLIIYSNYKFLQQAFKQTFIKKSGNETNGDLIKRHSNFANFGKLLYESIHLFGTDISSKKDLTFYHFLNKPIIFQHTFSYFYFPISTICNLESAIFYHKLNGNDTLLKLDRPHDGVCYYNYFECQWISDFSSQSEMIFLGSLLKIRAIMNIKLFTNYSFYLNISYIMTQMVHGAVLYEPMKKNEIYVTKTLRYLIENKNNDNNNDNMDGYTVQLFNHFALKMTDIHINLWLFELSCYEISEMGNGAGDKNIAYYLLSEDEGNDGNYGYNIFKQFFITKDNKWINIDIICKIFKNCNNIFIYNGDWIEQRLMRSIDVDTKFMDKLFEFLLSDNNNNLENIYIYLPGSGNDDDNDNNIDLNEILDKYKMKFSKIKWNLSIEIQSVTDYDDNFDNVECLCIRKASFL